MRCLHLALAEMFVCLACAVSFVDSMGRSRGALLQPKIHLLPSVGFQNFSEAFPSYIMYMSNQYKAQPHFFISIIVYGETEFTVSYTIYVDGYQVIDVDRPSSSEQLFLISQTHFSKHDKHIVRVNARIGRYKLFDKTMFISNGALPRDVSLFVQRDKPFYKPTDMVRFRCFGLTNLLNVTMEPLDIRVLDPNDNLMKIWYNQKDTSGDAYKVMWRSSAVIPINLFRGFQNSTGFYNGLPKLRQYRHNLPTYFAPFRQYMPGTYSCISIHKVLPMKPMTIYVPRPSAMCLKKTKFHEVMCMYVENLDRNVSKEWVQADANISFGVVSQEFQLSDQPVLGTWRLKIRQHNTKLEKIDSFKVEKYVLPRTKVTLDGDKCIYHLGFPAFFLEKHSIHLKVTARYSSGGPVKGRVSLRISIIGGHAISFEKIIKLNGKISYRFKLNEFYYHSNKIVLGYLGIPPFLKLIVVAKVIEDETYLVSVTPPMYVDIVAAPIQIDSPGLVNIKPKLYNEFTVQIVRADGKPLTIDDVTSYLNVTFIDAGKCISRLLCIPLDGKLVIIIPRVNFRLIKIYYYGVSEEFHYTLVHIVHLRQFDSIVPFFMKARLRQPISYAGDIIHVFIESTALLKKIYYLIVKDSQYIDRGLAYANDLFAKVHIRTKASWLPGVHIILTCITARGDVLVDALPAKLKVDFKYQVTGLFSPPQRIAGKETTLTMGAAPHSTVFIATVDERLELLGKNDYITADSINSEFIGSSPLTSPYAFADVNSMLEYYQLSWASNEIHTLLVFGPKVPSMDMHRRLRLILNNMAVSTVKIHDELPKVWIWTHNTTNSDGQLSISLETPDRITNWKTSAFAIHPNEGISVLEEKPRFLAFKEMYLSLDLPYSVVQKEKLRINVIVFNYFPTTMKVTVILKHSDGFIDHIWSPVKTTSVGAKDYKSISFKILLLVVGDVAIEFELHSNGKHYDSLKKILKVEPEGRTLYFNLEKGIDMSNGSRFEEMYIRIPELNLVPSSEIIEVSVTGDIMGPVIENLGRYVRLPRGCGEQTALDLVPNIYIYMYLLSRNSLDEQLHDKIVQFTRSGYQNQLVFQRRDGSYSAFKHDKKGSVWLTAFIAGAFQQVIDSEMDVYIDPIKLRKSLAWLMGKQRSDGHFVETGRVIHKNMQGGAAGGKALTAYALNALESLKYIYPKKARKSIDKARKYLNNLNKKQLDVYTLCILFYTYARLKEDKHFEEIKEVLYVDFSPGSLNYWKGDYAIEQTAYVLLAYAHWGDLKSGRDIFGWIISKRNSLGGFSNTQDTIVALDAMSMFALLLNRTSNATITIKAEGFEHTFDTITPLNIYVVQKKKAPSNARAFNVTAVGNGLAYIRVSGQYNVYSGSDNKFGLSVKVDTILDKGEARLTLTSCYKWSKKTTDPDMIVCTVKLPSGFGKESVRCTKRFCGREDKKCPSVKGCLNKYEAKNNTVDLYLNNLTYKNHFCTEITAGEMHRVTNRNLNIYISCVSYYTGKAIDIVHDPLRIDFVFDKGSY